MGRPTSSSGSRIGDEVEEKKKKEEDNAMIRLVHYEVFLLNMVHEFGVWKENICVWNAVLSPTTRPNKNWWRTESFFAKCQKQKYVAHKIQENGIFLLDENWKLRTQLENPLEKSLGAQGAT